MVTLLLVIFQILLLILKAYLSKNSEKAIQLKRIEDEQKRLNEAAEKAELEGRYDSTDPALIDQFQDAIDKYRYDATHPKSESH